MSRQACVRPGWRLLGGITDVGVTDRGTGEREAQGSRPCGKGELGVAKILKIDRFEPVTGFNSCSALRFDTLVLHIVMIVDDLTRDHHLHSQINLIKWHLKPLTRMVTIDLNVQIGSSKELVQ
jgi:hypothetical protein